MKGGLSLTFNTKNPQLSTFVPPGQAKVFKYLGMHIHIRSEHEKNGLLYPLEAHLVHQADDGSLAVIGIFYQFGAESPVWDTLTTALEAYQLNGNEPDVEMDPLD